MDISNSNGNRPNVLHFHGDNLKQLTKTFHHILNNHEVPPKISDELLIVSTWTDDERCSVLQQCKKSGIPITNCVPSDYDVTQPWYMPNKIIFFLNVLKNTDKDVILFVDGYDVLFTRLDDIVTKFENQKYRILFNPSCNNYPNVTLDKLYGRTKMGTYRYFNAGCVIGYREDLIKFYEESLSYINKPNPLNSEQLVMRYAFKKYSLDKEQDFVGIDYEGKIFKSMGYTSIIVKTLDSPVIFQPGEYVHPMTIIVTGSEGFIGKRLCDKLKFEKNITVIEVDTKNGTDATAVVDMLKYKDIDVVFHLAAQTSVFNKDLKQIEKDNISAFMDIAMACEKYGTKLVYASSSTANPKNTTSLYGMSKRFDEQFASIYCDDATGVRLHNVWSETPRPGTLYWHLLNDDETILYNGGNNIRCFTYVDDAVDGLIYAWHSNEKLLNCVNHEPMTILKFSELAQKYNPNIKFKTTIEKRELDNKLQSVEKSIPTIKLKYKKVEDVFKMIQKKN